ncbi:MAG: methyltransferase domain-containing protein, partial [Armatimonadetes bacterium]|nr:methyltransferase domain-containing protein [Armatimonadota bacterium]NIO98625.1 methyltransferase domain-containing protein [Armatimonadota bacterium]
KARTLGLDHSIRALVHDVRDPLPFDDNYFAACYSHMLFCMALTTAELQRLSDEIRRVLKPGGLNVYTVRHSGDPDYGKGILRGENVYEVNGFTVHFFSREKIELLA